MHRSSIDSKDNDLDVLELLGSEVLEPLGRLAGQQGHPSEKDALAGIIMHPAVSQEVHSARLIPAFRPR